MAGMDCTDCSESSPVALLFNKACILTYIILEPIEQEEIDVFLQLKTDILTELIAIIIGTRQSVHQEPGSKIISKKLFTVTTILLQRTVTVTTISANLPVVSCKSRNPMSCFRQIEPSRKLCVELHSKNHAINKKQFNTYFHILANW
eukprot:gene8492-9399_t